MAGSNLLQITGSIAILIIALSVGYYFVIFIPNKEAFQQEQSRKTTELEENKQKVEAEKSNQYIKCEGEANDEAKKSLESKVDLAKGTILYDQYKTALDKGMYLKDDYNEYYERCVRRYGLK